MIRRIMWASQHLEINTMTGKLQEESHPNTFDGDDDEDEEKIQNVMSTPFGVWRVDDTLNPYKQFKLWMGHTNFTINSEVANIIKHIPGIEVLSILTRYRFLVGVGELFQMHEVRLEIEKSLNCNNDEISSIDDTKLKKKVENLKIKLSKECDKWAILVLPNGEIDFTTNKCGNTDFTNKLLLYKKSVDHSTGILIESE